MQTKIVKRKVGRPKSVAIEKKCILRPIVAKVSQDQPLVSDENVLRINSLYLQSTNELVNQGQQLANQGQQCISFGQLMNPIPDIDSEIPQYLRNGTLKKVQKERKRDKSFHNAEERMRKEKINTWIFKLGELLFKAPGERQSKCSILEKAFKCIEEKKKLGPVIDDHSEELLKKMTLLEQALHILLALLKQHSIPIPNHVANKYQQLFKHASKDKDIAIQNNKQVQVKRKRICSFINLFNHSKKQKSTFEVLKAPVDFCTVISPSARDVRNHTQQTFNTRPSSTSTSSSIAQTMSDIPTSLLIAQISSDIPTSLSIAQIMSDIPTTPSSITQTMSNIPTSSSTAQIMSAIPTSSSIAQTMSNISAEILNNTIRNQQINLSVVATGESKLSSSCTSNVKTKLPVNFYESKTTLNDSKGTHAHTSDDQSIQMNHNSDIKAALLPLITIPNSSANSSLPAVTLSKNLQSNYLTAVTLSKNLQCSYLPAVYQSKTVQSNHLPAAVLPLITIPNSSATSSLPAVTLSNNYLLVSGLVLQNSNAGLSLFPSIRNTSESCVEITDVTSSSTEILSKTLLQNINSLNKDTKVTKEVKKLETPNKICEKLSRSTSLPNLKTIATINSTFSTDTSQSKSSIKQNFGIDCLITTNKTKLSVAKSNATTAESSKLSNQILRDASLKGIPLNEYLTDEIPDPQLKNTIPLVIHKVLNEETNSSNSNLVVSAAESAISQSNFSGSFTRSLSGHSVAALLDTPLATISCTKLPEEKHIEEFSAAKTNIEESLMHNVFIKDKKPTLLEKHVTSKTSLPNKSQVNKAKVVKKSVGRYRKPTASSKRWGSVVQNVLKNDMMLTSFIIGRSPSIRRKQSFKTSKEISIKGKKNVVLNKVETKYSSSISSNCELGDDKKERISFSVTKLTSVSCVKDVKSNSTSKQTKSQQPKSNPLRFSSDKVLNKEVQQHCDKQQQKEIHQKKEIVKSKKQIHTKLNLPNMMPQEKQQQQQHGLGRKSTKDQQQIKLTPQQQQQIKLTPQQQQQIKLTPQQQIKTVQQPQQQNILQETQQQKILRKSQQQKILQQSQSSEHSNLQQQGANQKLQDKQLKNQSYPQQKQTTAHQNLIQQQTMDSNKDTTLATTFVNNQPFLPAIKEITLHNRYLEIENKQSANKTTSVATAQCASPVISFPASSSLSNAKKRVNTNRANNAVTPQTKKAKSSKSFSAEALCKSANLNKQNILVSNQNKKQTLKVSKHQQVVQQQNIPNAQQQIQQFNKDHFQKQQHFLSHQNHQLNLYNEQLKHQPTLNHPHPLPNILNIFSPAAMTASNDQQQTLNQGLSNFSAETLLNTNCDMSIITPNISDTSFAENMQMLNQNAQLFTNFSADSLLNENPMPYAIDNLIAQNNTTNFWNPWISQDMSFSEQMFNTNLSSPQQQFQQQQQQHQYQQKQHQELMKKHQHELQKQQKLHQLQQKHQQTLHQQQSPQQQSPQQQISQQQSPQQQLSQQQKQQQLSVQQPPQHKLQQLHQQQKQAHAQRQLLQQKTASEHQQHKQSHQQQMQLQERVNRSKQPVDCSPIKSIMSIIEPQNNIAHNFNNYNILSAQHPNNLDQRHQGKILNYQISQVLNQNNLVNYASNGLTLQQPFWNIQADHSKAYLHQHETATDPTNQSIAKDNVFNAVVSNVNNSNSQLSQLMVSNKKNEKGKVGPSFGNYSLLNSS